MASLSGQRVELMAVVRVSEASPYSRADNFILEIVYRGNLICLGLNHVSHDGVPLMHGSDCGLPKRDERQDKRQAYLPFVSQ